MSQWPKVDPDDSDTDEDFLTHQARRFRILVIGKAGVGKSTLLSMVFGVSEESMGVRHQGQGAGQHSVWNGRTSRKNNLLVIHDSGGFEAAETSNLEEIKRFIAYCAGMTELERQLHCIWYCIDCTDVRFWSEAEKQFLAFFQNSNVPIIFVLTKFDLVVNQCLSTRIMRSAGVMVDWVPIHALAKGDAAEKVRSDIQSPLEVILGGGVKTEVVSNTESALVKRLVEETTRIITPNLKQLWIGAQQVIASNKRERAISSSIKAISTNYVRAGILIPMPLVKPLFHQDIFNRIYDTVRLQWNICDCGLLERDPVIARFRDLCNRGSMFSLGRAVDPSGIFSGPLYVREYLRWAVDLNIAFEIIFWRIKEKGKIRRPSQNGYGNGERVLEYTELDDVLETFVDSKLRVLAHSHINGRVGNFDFSLPFKRKDLREILQMAVDTACAEGAKEGLWTTTPQPLSPSSKERLAEMEG